MSQFRKSLQSRHTQHLIADEAKDALVAYLKREYRENQVEQGYDDPFPGDEPLQYDPDREVWLAAIERREHSDIEKRNREADGQPALEMHLPYAGNDIKRLEAKHGPQRLHILEIQPCVPVGSKFARCGFPVFKQMTPDGGTISVIDLSNLYSAVREAILDWTDVLAYELTPRGRAVKLVMEAPLTADEVLKVADICDVAPGDVKLIVTVVGTLTHPMVAAQRGGYEDESVYTARAIESLNAPDEYGINVPDTSEPEIYV